jgi:hypothetical protein
MKRFTLLLVIIISSCYSVLFSQTENDHFFSKNNQHDLFVEAFAINYAFHHQVFNNRTSIGFGLMAGGGIRFPITNIQFNMYFEDGEGMESFDAFHASYIELLKFQLTYGYFLSKNFLLIAGPFVSVGYFGDFTNTLNIGLESSIIYSYKWFLIGLRLQSGKYQIGSGKYSFYPLFVTPTIGIKF